MEGLSDIASALLLQSGYNSAVVTVGATLLGAAGGAAGTFIFLRKRAMVSDAVSHATLPGVAIAFLVMVAFGGDGRWLPGLLIGSAISAGVGLYLVDAIARTTRLSEDAAIGAILSVFFGFGIVLLTVIQVVPAGRQAGLSSFLLGSTAGMLTGEAQMIALAGLAAGIVVFLMRRPMTLVAFDPGYAASTGVDIRRTDLTVLLLALMVTVIGLKIVGLILIVALLIVPAVAARFWTDRVDHMVWIAAFIGAMSSYLGTAVSAAFADLPTGPMIVLVAFCVFVLSMVVSPNRGALAAALRRWRFRRLVHQRQGLLAMARGEVIYDGLTLSVLRRSGLIRADGVATLEGRAAAAKALHDEARWDVVRQTRGEEAVAERYDGLTPIEDIMTPDQLAHIDARIGGLELMADRGADRGD